MSTAIMAERRMEMSPRFKARMIAVLYLLEGGTSVFGQFFIHGRLVVSGDTAATATNILANQSLYWLGFTSALLAVAFHLMYTILFYDLFAPVNRSVSLLAAFVSVLACALQAFASLFQLAALLVLTGGTSVRALTVGQVQDLALLFLNLNAQTFNIYLLFFGIWLILIGYLIFRSTFLPRVIGVLLMLSGAGYLTLLSPPLAHALYPYYLAPDTIGESLLVAWLLVVGVNAQRWKEQASAAGALLRI